MFRKTCCVFALLCSGLVLYGQSTSGTITGIVTDQSGAVIGGAEVAVTDVTRGTKFSTESNSDGYYTQARIPEGLYRLEATKAGFKTFVQDNILLHPDQSARVDAKLAVGSSTESIEVTSAPTLLQTESAEVKIELNTTMINELPVLGRNVSSLKLLAPGANNQGNVGFAENAQGSVDTNQGGQPSGGQSMLLDGTENTENVLGSDVIIPNQDSVGSFSMTASSWDAEYGRAGAIITQISTKSGTDQLHGSLFEFVQNRAFNAADPFSHLKPPQVYNQFGGSFGGPIRKTKLYYFGDAEFKRQRYSGTSLNNLPNAQMRNGDFSTYTDSFGKVIPIFDPLTGNPDGTGRTQFPGNVIPQNRLNPIAQKILALLPPSPAGNAYTSNYPASASSAIDTQQYTARVDYYTSDKTRMFARYIYFGDSVNAPGAYGIAGGPTPGGGGVGGKSNGDNQNIASNITHAFSPNLLLEGRFGFSHHRINVLPPDASQELDNQVGLTGINNGTTQYGGLSTITFGENGSAPGYFQMGGGATSGSPLTENLDYYQYAANLVKISGTHTMKFGTDIRRYHNLRIQPGVYTGGFTGSTFNTGSYEVNTASLPNASNLSGSAVASLLLDQVNSWSQPTLLQPNIGNEYEWHISNYAQDSWKVTPKLTMNYGVRWEILTPPTTPKGAGTNFDPNTGLVEVAGVGSVSNSVNVKTRFQNLDPRFALAYQVKPGTVVRLGYARSYFPNVYNILISSNYPLVASANYTPALNYVTTFTFESPRPAAVFPTIPSSGTFMLPANQGITYNPTDRRNAYVDTFSLTVEHSFGSATSVSAGYVGTLGRDQYWNYNANTPVPGPGQQQQNRPFFQKFGFTNNINYRGNGESSNYHSLVLQANHKMSNGLSFQATYDWQKELDFGGYGVATNPYNVRGDKGPTNWVNDHVFSLGHVYQIPIGRGQKYLSNMSLPADLVLGGWQFSGITMIQSGYPYTVWDSSNANLNSTFGLRADLTGISPKPAHRSRQQWYNPAAFQSTTQLYREGTESRNKYFGPGMFEADWSGAKHFKYERYDLEFRTDAFNVFNHTNLGNPNNTFNSASAGQITGLAGGRTMRKLQMGLHLTF